MPNLSKCRDRLEEEPAILDVHIKLAQTPESHSGVGEQIGDLEAAVLAVSGKYAARCSPR